MEVSSGLPVTVEAQVVDGCGEVTTDGAAVVTFSTGEPAVNLAAWPDGVFRGTWTPIKPSASTVFLRFSFVPREGDAVARATASGVVSGSGTSPVINSAATVNTASRAPTGASFAPGQLLTISGEGLATGTESALDSPRQLLAGARVRFGSRVLPVFYASPAQLNIAIPFDLTPGTSGQLFLDRDGIPASPVSVTVSAAQPGIFTVDESGAGRGVIRDADGNLIGVDNRAARGSTYWRESSVPLQTLLLRAGQNPAPLAFTAAQ